MNDQQSPKQWEQQSEEPQVWFNRFLLFLEQGETKQRSLLQAYKTHLVIADKLDENGNYKTSGKPIRTVPQVWRTMAKLWEWEDRARSFDGQHQNNRMQKRLERLQELEEKEWESAMLLLARAKEMLSYPIVTQVSTDGDRTIIIEPAKWVSSDIAKFFQLFSTLARSSTGKQDMGPLDALQVLLEAGWVTPEVYAAADKGLTDTAELVRQALDPKLRSQSEVVSEGV
ncbi:MAG TPA: hypothetical protein V6D07_18775 [Trichocoleus sp.]